MHRFYDPESLRTAGLQSMVTLKEDESHHASRVLRLQPGDGLVLFDGHGRSAQAELVTYQRDQAVVKVIELQDHAPDQPEVTLATALPKGSRGDDMINQLCQVGVNRVIPLRTRRSVAEFSDHRRKRFERIIIESAKQSGRAYLPVVEDETDLKKVLAESMDLRLLASPLAEPAQHQLHEQMRKVSKVLILIGPEGGWAPEEIEQAEAVQCVPWCIGPHVLRIETAAVAAVSVLRYMTLV